MKRGLSYGRTARRRTAGQGSAQGAAGSAIGLLLAVASVSWLMDFVIGAGFVASFAVVFAFCGALRLLGVGRTGEAGDGA